jgi:hypothetical protein
VNIGIIMTNNNFGVSVDILDRVRSSEYKLSIATTGGGHSIATSILDVAGASQLLLNYTCPYDGMALDFFLGEVVPKSVTQNTALRLATKSFYLGCRTTTPNDRVIGIGITASLATAHERTGRVNQAHIAVHCSNRTIHQHIVFYPDNHDRTIQERIIHSVTLHILRLILDGDNYLPFPPELVDVIYDSTRSMGMSDSYISLSELRGSWNKVAVFCGSWNPYHAGHLEILEKSEQILQTSVYHELSTFNADKGDIDWITVHHRLSTMTNPGLRVATSNCSTFVEKAYALHRPDRQIIFIVGADTWVRICDPKYAGDLDTLYTTFKSLGVKFLVFGRNLLQGNTVEAFNAQLDDHPILSLLIDSDIATNHNNPLRSSDLRNMRTAS